MRTRLISLTCCLALALTLAACSGDGDDDTPEADIAPPSGYTVAASGIDDGLTWTLSSKPDTDGGTCWYLATEPKVPLVQTNEECRVAPDPANPRDFNSEFPFETDATGDYDIVVGIIPDEITEAEFGFANGDEALPVFIDEQNGIVVWAGKSRPFVGGVTVTLADGVRLGCGPGDIVSSTELEGKPEDELLDIRRHPWTCLERA